MTTIATDGETMACDGRGCVNDTIAAEDGVKIVACVGGLLGLSGRASTRDKLRDWLEGRTEFPANEGDWSAIHLTAEGVCRYYSSEAGQAYHVASLPAATGSGREFAIGAMLAGKSPMHAVRIAAMRDPFTGGNITMLRLESQCHASSS